MHISNPSALRDLKGYLEKTGSSLEKAMEDPKALAAGLSKFTDQKIDVDDAMLLVKRALLLDQSISSTEDLRGVHEKIKSTLEHSLRHTSQPAGHGPIHFLLESKTGRRLLKTGVGFAAVMALLTFRPSDGKTQTQVPLQTKPQPGWVSNATYDQIVKRNPEVSPESIREILYGLSKDNPVYVRHESSNLKHEVDPSESREISDFIKKMAPNWRVIVANDVKTFAATKKALIDAIDSDVALSNAIDARGHQGATSYILISMNSGWLEAGTPDIYVHHSSHAGGVASNAQLSWNDFLSKMESHGQAGLGEGTDDGDHLVGLLRSMENEISHLEKYGTKEYDEEESHRSLMTILTVVGVIGLIAFCAYMSAKHGGGSSSSGSGGSNDSPPSSGGWNLSGGGGGLSGGGGSFGGGGASGSW